MPDFAMASRSCCACAYSIVPLVLLTRLRSSSGRPSCLRYAMGDRALLSSLPELDSWVMHDTTRLSVAPQTDLKGNRMVTASPWAVVRAMGRAYPLLLHKGIDAAVGESGGDEQAALAHWIAEVGAVCSVLVCVYVAVGLVSPSGSVPCCPRCLRCCRVRVGGCCGCLPGRDGDGRGGQGGEGRDDLP